MGISSSMVAAARGAFDRSAGGLRRLGESGWPKGFAVYLLRFAAASYASLFVLMTLVGLLGFDSHAYFATRQNHLYAHPSAGGIAAYLYSPAFAQAIKPLTLLSWPVFRIVWMALIAGIYAWLLAPVNPRWRVFWVILVLPDLFYGNVFSLFALVLVWGRRYAGLWAFPLLTKITPAVGVLWFMVRCEWRQFTIALGVTAVAVLVSAGVWGPHLWVEWLRMLTNEQGYATRTTNPVMVVSFPLYVRLPIAYGLVVLAARKDRYTLLVVAMIIATPVFGPVCFAVLAALPRLRAAELREAAASLAPDSSPAFSI